MTGAQSALEVENDMTFLDLTVRQIELLNTENNVDVPLAISKNIQGVISAVSDKL